ncbi:hypothetical protein AC249_AIPGENE16600 [Exaiptasia diaphana]|nr:hypothetical protein AC249_AIPGENE16600 [Exaiptasia diaphana]
MKRLSDDIRWRGIYHELIYGSSIKETCRALFVGKTFVSKIRQLYKRTGNVAVHTRRGRPRLLIYAENNPLKFMILAKPELYLP